MKGGIGGNHRQRILLLDRNGEFRVVGADSGQIFRTVILRGKLGRYPVHQHKRIEIGMHVEEIDIRHHGGAVRQRIDQPLARKPHQCLADGRA
ncbi:hypothetical protein D3C86_1099420 [compost metagenome]